MSTVKPRLTLVTGIKRLSLREKLMAQAKLVYPHNESLAGKWVEAKLTLGHAQPKVRIGTNDVAKFQRTEREAWR